MLGFGRSTDRFQCVKDSSIQQPQRYGSISRECEPLPAAPTSRRMKKLLVSGLPAFLDSNGLFCFFEQNFGPVMDAVVLPFHSADGQRGGFGIVTFKDKAGFLEATRSKSGFVFGKKVVIDLIDAQVARDLLQSADDSSRKQYGDDAPPASLVNSPSLPPWAEKFRDWLPGFLTEVSKRLADGEAYPLCSLKGDFRATCGLEIDHLSLGFEKLRDFIRAWPEICEPKLVPVGNGPATHIVLQRVIQDKAAATKIQHPESAMAPDQPAASKAVERPPPIKIPRDPIQPIDTGQASLFSRSVFTDKVANVTHGAFDRAKTAASVPPGVAVVCKLCNNEARWFAIPCGHLLLCDSCKGRLGKCGLVCLVCRDPVEKWVANAAEEVHDAPACLENFDLDKLRSFIRAWPEAQRAAMGSGPGRFKRAVAENNENVPPPPPPPPGTPTVFRLQSG